MSEISNTENKLGNLPKIVFIILLGYISLVPFYYYPPVNLWGKNIPVAKYLPLFLVFVLLLLSLKRITLGAIKKEKLNLYVTLYFLATLLSGAGQAYYRVSFLKAVYYGLTGVLVYFIVYSWQLSQSAKIRLLRSIVLFGFIASVYGIVTIILGSDILFGKLDYSKSNLIDPAVFLKMGRISSTFGNPHFLAGFLSAVFPISVYLFHLDSAATVGKRAVWRAMVPVVIFIAAMLTFSIGAFVGMVKMVVISAPAYRFPD